MSALDSYSLSTDELDIIMHKIANKQSVIRQDWSKVRQIKMKISSIFDLNLSYNMVKKSILKNILLKL